MGLNLKCSLYMSSNQQNLTIGSIRLKSDYRVVKISLTTGLGSYPVRCTLHRDSFVGAGPRERLHRVSRGGGGARDVAVEH